MTRVFTAPEPGAPMQALQALGGVPAEVQVPAEAESIVSMGGRDDHDHHDHHDHHPIYHPTHYTHYAEDVDEYSGGGGQSLCSGPPGGPVITHQAPAIYIVNGGGEGTVAVPDAVPDAVPALPAPAFEALDAPAPPPAADAESDSLAFLLFAADFMLTQLVDPFPPAITAYVRDTEPYLQRLQQNPDDRAAAKEWFRALQTMAAGPSPVPTNPDGWAGFQGFVRFMAAGQFPFFTD
jgi:hypothetical protein